MPIRIRSLIVTTLALAVLAPAAIAADNPVLEAYAADITRLVDSPGASSSVAAGLVNPAAWPVQGHGGTWFAFEAPDERFAAAPDQYFGVLSLRSLGLGWRLRDGADTLGVQHDFTVGLGGGDRDLALGLSYTWSAGDMDVAGRSRRLTLGAVRRWRMLSLGASHTSDLVGEHRFLQADLGLRPFGPRVTLFADAAACDNDDFEEIAFGYGAELHVIPGLRLAARARDGGELSLRLEWAFQGSSGRVQTGARHHLDDEQESVATLVSTETGPGPHLGQFHHWGAKRYPEIDLRGERPYRTYRWLDDRTSFLETLDALRRCAEDPAVGGVVLNLSGMRLSPAKLWELRAQLEGLRAGGRTVTVYVDRLGLFDYMLASAADEIWMDDRGILNIRGLNLGRSYYRRLLEKMGVGIDELRFFTYKSAAETLSRTSMSEADREQGEALIEDWYETAVGLSARARGMDRAAWDRLVEEKGELLADEALAAGLVDRIGDYHEARDMARETAVRAGGGSPAARLAGLRGDPVWAQEEWGEPDRIAVLYAIGACAMDEGIEGRRLSRIIRKLRDDDKIKAIVLRADSPGGDDLPSDLVARELKAAMAKKPVIVSQGQVAASGGYWISMHSDALLASPFTLTGSIGVISLHFWDDGIGEKMGLDYDHVQRGSHADVFSGPSLPFIGLSVPHRPLTGEERARFEAAMRDLYGDFVAKVAEGRHMTPAAVDAIGQGRVWSGADGLDNGLVDEIGGLWRGLWVAREKTGLPAGRPLAIVEGPSLGAFDLGRLLGGPSLPFGLRLPWSRAEEPAPAEPESVLQGDAWRGLDPVERLFLERVLRAGGRPLPIMAPVSIEGVTLEP
ncbi:MAG: S49 family peptidase [Candidatus Krumholzibacteriota bacterium]|nr:S49 family peptidase [Candidatus Krumholzibacteriota bacterium]